jgi:LysM repeat protein
LQQRQAPSLRLERRTTQRMYWMNRRQLAFIVLVNGLVSLVIALAVVWIFEIRRPEAEELALLYGPRPEAILAATPALVDPVAAPVAASANDEAPVPEAPAPDAPAPPTPEAGEEQEIYVVRDGDSLVAIAARFNVSIDEIVQANSLSNPDFLFSGQRLIIPGNQRPDSQGPTATPAVIQGVEVASVDGAGILETEFALVVNDSDRAFSLQGWQLARDGGPAYVFGNVPLFPGGSVRVHTRAGSDTSIDLYWGQTEAQWQSGAVAQLLNERGALVHTFTVP